jgi:hypothetical protein
MTVKESSAEARAQSRYDDDGVRSAATLYFKECGRAYTEITARAAVERAIELGLGFIVVGSTTGFSAMKVYEAGQQAGWRGQLVVVTEHVGYHAPGHQAFDPGIRSWLEERGVRVHTGTHAFSSVSRAFRLRWQGIDMLETIAEAFRRISRGTKTGVEASIMAADAGLVPTDEDVVAVGGTGGGADTAIVLQPASMNRFFDLKVREFVCMPQARTAELEPTDLSSPESAAKPEGYAGQRTRQEI